MNNPIIIYYANTIGTESYLTSISTDTLKSVLSDIKKNKTNDDQNNSLFSCRAFLSFVKNLYMISNPIDINITVGDYGRMVNNGNNDFFNLFNSRQPQISNLKNFSFQYLYWFYSEESVEIEIMSPFMHNSNFVKNAFIVPGSFDISKWFRPINPEIQFLPGHTNNVMSEKNDPLLYIRFKTDRPVILKPFFMSTELFNIADTTVGYKKYERLKPLQYLYDIFYNSGLNKKTLKLIQENLI